MTSVQGYTINDTNTASFLAVRKNDSEMTALAYITNLNSIPKVNPDRRLWHANDCAFYKGNYFIAMGSNNDNDLITDIKCFDKSLERIATYSYVPMSGETQLNYNFLHCLFNRRLFRSRCRPYIFYMPYQ